MRTVYRVNVSKYPYDALFDFNTALAAVNFLETAAKHLSQGHKGKIKLELSVVDIEEKDENEDAEKTE